MEKALFIDLDDTLIQTRSGEVFPKHKDDWEFKPGILGKLKKFYNKGYRIIIVSNQAGIDEGYIKPVEFKDKLSEIVFNIDEAIFNNGPTVFRFPPEKRSDIINIDTYVSISKDDKFRKPRPDAALDAADKFNLELSQCIMVGDASGLWKRKTGVPDTTVFKTDSSETIKIGDSLEYEKSVTPKITLYYTVIKDFSDSDKKFAENAGIGTYYDIEEFLKLED